MGITTQLSALLAPYCAIPPSFDVMLKGITSDSREVSPQDLFLTSCPPMGEGAPYIEAAVRGGAAAVVRNSPTEEIHMGFLQSPEGHEIPQISLPSLAHRMGPIASSFYQHPSRQFPVIGITGTNGKTTISFLLAQALTALHQPNWVVGTLGYGVWNDLTSSGFTTPMPVGLQKILFEASQQGIKTIAMEVSSHSLVQHRVAGMNFDAAVFTNLTRDHLDFHGDMAHYGAAKKQLLDWPHLKARIINLDDAFGYELAKHYEETLNDKESFLWYAQEASKKNPSPRIFFKNVSYDEKGIEGHVVTPQGELFLKSKLLGVFNGSNLLAAIAVLIHLGYPLKHIENVLPQLHGAPGRMQVMNATTGPKVVIDYAHTPDALESTLKALRPYAKGRVLCVMGCGGQRDPGKRPLMGNVASQHSDVVIITSDNPRFESPEAIIEDIMKGIKKGVSYHVEVDRRKAIEWALENATPLDLILIAGKGHESYQQVKEEFHHFSDEEEVQKWIDAKRGFYEVK